MTLARAILADKTGSPVQAGDTVEVDVDLLMAHDGTFPLGLRDIEEQGIAAFDPGRLLLVCDHFSPPATVERADIQKLMIDYARDHDIPLALGSGICHQLLLEHPLVLPGSVVIGADSHTVTAGALGAFATGVGTTDYVEVMRTGRIWLKVPASIKIVLTGRLRPHVMGKDVALEVLRLLGSDGAIYKSLEFFDHTGGGAGGCAVAEIGGAIGLDGRAAIANMSVETGAKCGLFNPDALLWDHLSRERGQAGPWKEYAVDDDGYERILEIDCGALDSLLVAPHDPGNVVEIARHQGRAVSQVFIGSCTAGRLEDLRVAARILKDRSVHPHTKVVVIPASRRVFLQAMEKGYIQDLVAAGAMLSNPSCGPCCNIDKGLLAAGEVCVSTSNRNFQGRMGSPKSDVYLASPATAAATALHGRITSPDGYL